MHTQTQRLRASAAVAITEKISCVKCKQHPVSSKAKKVKVYHHNFLKKSSNRAEIWLGFVQVCNNI